MKIFPKLVGIVFLFLACTLSCSKDNSFDNVNSKKTYYLEVLGEFEELQADNKASAISTVVLRWNAGDKVYVFEGSDCLGYLTASLADSDGFTALLSGTIESPSSESPTLSFVNSNLLTEEPTVTDGKLSFDFSSQTSSELPFVVYGTKNIPSITSPISNLSVKFYFASSAVKISVYGLGGNTTINKAKLSGVNTKCVLTLGNGEVSVGGSTLGAISKTQANWVASTSGQAFVNMGIPVCETSTTRTLSIIQGSDIYKKLTMNYSIQAATSLATIVGPKKVDLFAGEFSVSPTKTVHFTKKGNLYWDGSAWNLEAKQYDYPTNWDASHVTHLYWTKSASAAYAETFSDGTCTTDDHLFCDGSDDSHIINVGDLTGLYALSQSEWDYLIESRASNLRKAGVTVDGKDNCLVIAHDAYEGTIADEYTAEEWQAAEANGLICLPSYGRRDGNVLKNKGVGYYWTSSCVTDTSKSGIMLLNYDIYQTTESRNKGVFIRLVTD